jgi:GTP cyclohydrolase I
METEMVKPKAMNGKNRIIAGSLVKEIQTPLRDDAFDLSDQQKIEKITFFFSQIMETLGLDLSDDSLKDTPLRVAKMYINEAFSGLDPANKPKTALFDNKYNYSKMLIEQNITLFSYCEHHFVPIIGKVHVAYISEGKVIGLSKINRLVQYYSKRPQVQERLTQQILEGLKEAIGTEHVAVVVDAVHLCVAARGIKDVNSSTMTVGYSGKFNEEETKRELLSLLKLK